MSKTFRVIFQPFGRQVVVRQGQSILDAARACGIEMNAPCGGKGTCGGCRVQIVKGTPAPSESATHTLSPEELGRNLRLACQTHVDQDMTVVIPRETLLFDQQILESGVEYSVALEPGVESAYLQMQPPGVEDQRSDGDRVLDALESQEIRAELDLGLAREMPAFLRKNNWCGTATVVGGRLVDFDRGDTSDASYGVAVDIGTTTVVAALMNLRTGQEMAVASCANPQASRGDDVVSRIEYCQSSKQRLREMQRMLSGSLNELLEELAGKADIRRTSIYEMVIVGNTTMTHMVLRLEVANIAQTPFIAAVRSGSYAEPRDLGIAINPRGRIYVGPNVAGFVGADTVGVILAANLHASDGLRMVIDIGTNGELVLGNRERLLACSTAAGPAFEGARIQYGMRASAGAIDRVEMEDGHLKMHVIGDVAPIGLCGTGLIEALTALLECGVVEATGRMRGPEEVEHLPEAIRNRVIRSNSHASFVLTTADEGEHAVMLTQKDVREVQLAKGAIAAGAQVLLAEYGATVDDLDEVLLAGAFGNYIRPERARAVGLLPEVPLEKVRFIGNAAGTGARMLLLNKGLRATAEEMSLGVEHVELSSRADFQMLFADCMMFNV